MKGPGGPENASCPYKGVRQRTWGKWVAELRHTHGSRFWLGTLDNDVDAALAYDKVSRRVHGEYAKLNFLDQPPEVQPENASLSSQRKWKAKAKIDMNLQLSLLAQTTALSAPNSHKSYPGTMPYSSSAVLNRRSIENVDQNEGKCEKAAKTNEKYVPTEEVKKKKHK